MGARSMLQGWLLLRLSAIAILLILPMAATLGATRDQVDGGQIGDGCLARPVRRTVSARSIDGRKPAS